eukprot:6196295-Pleurochrysis_carterae.AAC.1
MHHNGVCMLGPSMCVATVEAAGGMRKKLPARGSDWPTSHQESRRARDTSSRQHRPPHGRPTSQPAHARRRKVRFQQKDLNTEKAEREPNVMRKRRGAYAFCHFNAWGLKSSLLCGCVAGSNCCEPIRCGGCTYVELAHKCALVCARVLVLSMRAA